LSDEWGMDVLSQTIPQPQRNLTSGAQQGERARDTKRDGDNRAADGGAGQSAKPNVQVSVSDVAKARAESRVGEVQAREDGPPPMSARAAGTESGTALTSQQGLRSQAAQAAGRAKLAELSQEADPVEVPVEESLEGPQREPPQVESSESAPDGSVEMLADKAEEASASLAEARSSSQQAKLAEKATKAYGGA